MHKKSALYASGILSLYLFSESLVAACRTDIPNTASISDFEFLANGLARHRLTNLVWKRCYEGFQWSDNGTPDEYEDDVCTDNGTTLDNLYTWPAALQAANQAAEFRVPNIKELTTILSSACSAPALNDSVFPLHTQSETLFLTWSNSPAITIAQGRAHGVDISSGMVDVINTSSASRLLLLQN